MGFHFWFRRYALLVIIKLTSLAQTFYSNCLSRHYNWSWCWWQASLGYVDFVLVAHSFTLSRSLHLSYLFQWLVSALNSTFLFGLLSIAIASQGPVGPVVCRTNYRILGAILGGASDSWWMMTLIVSDFYELWLFFVKISVLRLFISHGFVP